MITWPGRAEEKSRRSSPSAPLARTLYLDEVLGRKLTFGIKREGDGVIKGALHLTRVRLLVNGLELFSGEVGIELTNKSPDAGGNIPALDN